MDMNEEKKTPTMNEQATKLLKAYKAGDKKSLEHLLKLLPKILKDHKTLSGHGSDIFIMERASNGYIVKRKHWGEEEIIVCQDKDDDNDEMSANIAFLWEMAEHIDVCYDKYSSKNLFIGYAPGDSYEGPFDNEYREPLEHHFDKLQRVFKEVVDRTDVEAFLVKQGILDGQWGSEKDKKWFETPNEIFYNLSPEKFAHRYSEETPDWLEVLKTLRNKYGTPRMT